jgi:hypothetical protein
MMQLLTCLLTSKLTMIICFWLLVYVVVVEWLRALFGWLGSQAGLARWRAVTL